MTDEAEFIIKEDRYTLTIIKNNKSNAKKSKKGISIFKKTLELNELNEDNINLILNHSKKEDLIYSYAIIGFISISGLICFAYCSEKDIKEIGAICLIKVYQIRNIRYIIIDPEIDAVSKQQILKFFKRFTEYQINKGLIFAQNLLNLDLSFDAFYHHFYDINKNICHINPKINFCYNYDYMTYFRKFLSEDFSTHIICGYYFQNIIKTNVKEQLTLHLIIKDKEFKESKIENEKFIREIEIILTPVEITKNQIFHFLFFSYIGDFLNDDNLFYNLLKKEQPENKIDNGPIIILDIHNKIKGKKIEEINKFIINIENKINNKLGNKNKIIFIQKKEEITKIIEKNKQIFEEIKFNYELKGIEYITEFEKKQLLIVSDNEINSLNIIENILCNIKYKFLDENNEMIYYNEINDNVKTVMKSYRNFIKIKNNNFLKIENIPSEPINEDFLNKKMNQMKEKKENVTKNEDIEFDFGTLENINNFKTIKINENDNKNNNLNIEEEERKNYIIKNIEKNINKISIYIVTNNVADYDLENNYDEELLNKLLFPKKIKEHFSKNNFPTFYCIGLQEIVQLNTSNIIFAYNKNIVNLWEKKIAELLQQHYNYTLQYKENLVGILFLFFVKTSEAKYINSINKSVVKAGFLNKLGNKGYIFYEFKYYNKKFSFCTGHLTAGEKEKQFQNRANLLMDILNHKNDKNPTKFYQSDYYFIFGDMNFRVKFNQNKFFEEVDEIQNLNKKVYDDTFIRQKSLLAEDIFSPYVEQHKIKGKKRFSSVEKINHLECLTDKIKDKSINQNNNIDFLNKRKLDEDQFKYYFLNRFLDQEELNELKKFLKNYNITEHKIKFLPTYKYIKGYNFYNISKRIPSWTDRILFKNNKEIKCLYYDKINLIYSDHRPVYALFEIVTKNHKHSL